MNISVPSGIISIVSITFFPFLGKKNIKNINEYITKEQRLTPQCQQILFTGQYNYFYHKFISNQYNCHSAPKIVGQCFHLNMTYQSQPL
jgi:hypothetical protein